MVKTMCAPGEHASMALATTFNIVMNTIQDSYDQHEPVPYAEVKGILSVYECFLLTRLPSKKQLAFLLAHKDLDAATDNLDVLDERLDEL